jgi:hypothetical protein
MFASQSVWAITDAEIKEIQKKYGQGEVFVFYGKKPIGVWTLPQFEAMVQGDEYMSSLTKAEKEGTVNVILAKDPWKVKIGEVFESKMDIVWKDADNGKVLKKVTIDVKLKATQDGKIFVIYKDIAAIAFPVALLVILVLIIIITVK